MSANVRLKVVTPTGAVIDETVSAVTACSQVGEFCVLPEHRPILASLKAGRFMVEQDGETKIYVTDIGFCEGGIDHVNVMTQHCIAQEDVDLSKVEVELAQLQEQLVELQKLEKAEKKDDEASDGSIVSQRASVEAAISWAKAQLFVAKDQ